MKNHSTTLFWILTDALIIFAIPFFPSVFSVFCIITAAFFAPIDVWQDFLNKHLNKPIKSAIIALGVAFVIALFPISPIVTGIYKLVNPETYSPKNTSSVVYYEEKSQNSNDFTYDLTSTSSEVSVTSENTVTSSENSTIFSSFENTQTSSKTKKQTYSSKEDVQSNNEVKDNEKSNTVYRTPSGKRYHQSATCGGKNSYEVSFDDAIKDGLTPCKKCVK